MGKIVLEDFNGGNGFYKVNLNYLNKEQVEEIEEMVKTWNERTKTFDNESIKACIEMCLTDANEQRFKDYETTLKDCLAWLEKQGEQILANSAKTCKNEQKPAWSEEDDKIQNDLIWIIEAYRKNGFNKGHFETANRAENWLKSLKDRVQPQTTWKPSDEQMITLRHVISGCSYDIEPLVELETKLKEL